MIIIYFRCRGKEVKEVDIVTFVADDKNVSAIQRYISQVVHSLNCDPASQSVKLPTIIVIDNLQHIASLSDVFSGFLLAKPANWFVVFAGLFILLFSFKCYADI